MQSDEPYNEIKKKVINSIVYPSDAQPTAKLVETIAKPEKYDEKRKLPVKPKEKVYDEWAAVIQHQDEVAENTKKTEIQEFKIQQQQYYEELEDQINAKNIEKTKKQKSEFTNEKGEAEKLNMMSKVQLLLRNLMI